LNFSSSFLNSNSNSNLFCLSSLSKNFALPATSTSTFISSAQLRLRDRVLHRCREFIRSSSMSCSKKSVSILCSELFLFFNSEHELLNSTNTTNNTSNLFSVKNKFVDETLLYNNVQNQYNLQMNQVPSFYGKDNILVPLIADQVSLPDTLHQVSLDSLLPTNLKQLYQDPSSVLTSAANTLSLDSSSIISVPKYYPPRVCGPREQYIKLIQRMSKVGMLEYTSKPKVVNGIFTVRKDENSQRLIIDARNT
jgi:hypothetical protein